MWCNLATQPSRSGDHAVGHRFETSWVRRVNVDIDGLTVPFLGLDDLRTNKRASGRPQDIADLFALGDDE
jgi:hypothetical protein